MRVELDKAGSWADILDLDDLRDGHRKAVNRVIRFEVDDKNKPVISGSMDDDMRDAMLRLVVTNWSNTLGPLPKDDPEALDRLTIEQGKNLRKAIDPHMEAVREKDAPVRANPVPTEG